MNSREIAFKIIYGFMQNKDIYLKEELDKYLRDVKKREDRALITYITYGVIRDLKKLDWIVEELVERKKISQKVRTLLWMGIFSIMEFERVPHYATLFEIVEIAKKQGRGRDFAFVNAILRKFLREKDSIKLPKDPTIIHSFPKWFVSRWKNRLNNKYIDFLKANNQIPPENIRVNKLKIERHDLIELLKKEGVGKIEKGMWEDSLHIYAYPAISGLESFKKGYFTIQDEGSMWVSYVLSPKPEEVVLDIASAPGGKALHMASMMKNRGKIYGLDIKEEGIKREIENARRLGVNKIDTIKFDATQKIKKFFSVIDKVLLDAPCTNLGTIRRRPELKWKVEEADIKRMSNLQKIMLNNTSLYPKIGGFLEYSVCSLEKEETIEVVEDFLSKHKEYEFVPIEGKKYLFLYPHKKNTDGFFIALFKKIS